MSMHTSRPSRARGLKRFWRLDPTRPMQVAPLAGAWIETIGMQTIGARLTRSRPSRARGLKLCF